MKVAYFLLGFLLSTCSALTSVTQYTIPVEGAHILINLTYTQPIENYPRVIFRPYGKEFELIEAEPPGILPIASGTLNSAHMEVKGLKYMKLKTKRHYPFQYEGRFFIRRFYPPYVQLKVNYYDSLTGDIIEPPIRFTSHKVDNNVCGLAC